MPKTVQNAEIQGLAPSAWSIRQGSDVNLEPESLYEYCPESTYN